MVGDSGKPKCTIKSTWFALRVEPTSTVEHPGHGSALITDMGCIKTVQQVRAGVTYIEHMESSHSQAVFKLLQWNTETACTAFERN